MWPQNTYFKRREIPIMKNLIKKSIATICLAVSAVSVVTGAAYASFSFDSFATSTGSGGRAIVTAYTAQSDERYTKTMTVSARTNDGTYDLRSKEPSNSDQVTLTMTTAGAVTQGTSWHDWVTAVDELNRTKSVNFR